MSYIYRQFTLDIRLGNEAMTSLDDVASALHSIAAKLRDGVTGGTVRDTNGNMVGGYTIKTKQGK